MTDRCDALILPALTAVIIRWVALNAAVSAHRRSLGRFSYPLLQDAGSALPLYLAIPMLITQRREDEPTRHPGGARNAAKDFQPS